MVLPRILPVPSPWFAILYFIPTAIELWIALVWWRRISSFPVEQQPRLRGNVLGALGLICAIAAIVSFMLKPS